MGGFSATWMAVIERHTKLIEQMAQRVGSIMSLLAEMSIKHESLLIRVEHLERWLKDRRLYIEDEDDGD